MKKGKRIIVFLAAVSMLLMNVVYSSAQSAIVDKEKKGSIHIYKYAVENLDDYQVSAIGEQQEVEGLESIRNIEFTVTRVQDEAVDTASAVPLEGEAGYSKSISTNENGLAVFAELEQGVYLVQESVSPAVEAPVEDFLVSVPMTNPKGNGWIYDVYVYPKNELAGAPEIALYVQAAGNRYMPVEPGDEVKWIAASEIPAGIGSAAEYKITGTIQEHLLFTEGSQRLYFEDTQEGQVELEAEKDYDVKAEGDQFTIHLLDDGKEKLTAAAGRLYVEFRTIFLPDTQELEEILASDISVSMALTYTNELEISYQSFPEQPASIYTGGLNLLKVDGRNENTLENAAFKIYRSLEDANGGNNAIQNPRGEGDWTVVTGEDGKAVFYGLSYGGQGVAPQEGTTVYYLVEVQAPGGYNLLKAPVEVTVSGTSHLEENRYNISNRTGFTLPVTGGRGTLIFIGMGIMILLGAWILYRITRQKGYEE